ncbi:MAG: DEAD/DEAH box helicase [Epsilonproteobacteria bacterium]|nr:DEAD/DEAH box helicase [Campylobacterota bacterium]
MNFKELNLSKEVLAALAVCDYKKPTPIQEAIISQIIKNKDVQAIAPTGSGKTAAFSLPIIDKLNKNLTNDFRLPRALILVPTRELAVQIDASIKKYAVHTELKSATIFGGTKMEPQVNKLKKTIDILVATPGRLAEHIKEKNVNLTHINTLVLDEADTMLEMGFSEEMSVIFDSFDKKPQTMLFSATLGESIKKLGEKILESAYCVNIDKTQKGTHKIEQSVYYINRDEKNALTSFLIGKNYQQQFIVFTRTKQTAEEVFNYLVESGLKCDSLHGDKTHGKRQVAIKRFRDKEVQVLVATDITARGIDIKGLEYIINYDIPNSVEDYIHRIGRTGRAGMDGNAISLVSSSEVYSQKVIERKLHIKMKVVKEEGFGNDVEDTIKAPKIVIRKEAKRDVTGAFGQQNKKVKPKKKTTKRDGDPKAEKFDKKKVAKTPPKEKKAKKKIDSATFAKKKKSYSSIKGR